MHQLNNKERKVPYKKKLYQIGFFLKSAKNECAIGM